MKTTEATFPDTGLIGFLQTLHMLRDPKVQEFVSGVRRREELEEPTDVHTLRSNLEKHGPDDFIEEALPVAMAYWVWELSAEAQEYHVPDEWDAFTQAAGIEGVRKRREPCWRSSAGGWGTWRSGRRGWSAVTLSWASWKCRRARGSLRAW